MKALRQLSGIIGLAAMTHIVAASSLELHVQPVFRGEPIQLGSIRYQNGSGESFSVTRLSWLASGFAFERADGSWLELTNQFAWFDLEKNRLTTRLGGIPTGSYRSVRFQVGLDESDNHRDPATFSAEHPLNPNLNGLHWSWQGGYVFLALEGLWRRAGGPFDGFSYHLARETNRISITVVAPFDFSSDERLELDLDLATILDDVQSIGFGRDGTSTHSRDGDPIARALRVNLANAFRVRDLSKSTLVRTDTNKTKPVDLPSKFTAFRFQTSAAFPVPELPADNPLIVERVELGRRLFNETALSKDNTISCASCHQETSAFSDDRAFSLGISNRIGTRNAMPLFNLAWKNSFFWDGRALSLRAQTLMPIQDHAEMDQTLTNAVMKLQSADYSALFAAAFESPEITPEKIGLALEQFLLTLTSFDSKFDRALRNEEQLNAMEQRGLELFMTEYDPRRGQFGADCFHCHGGALFQNQSFANNGLDAEFKDIGRARVTGREADRGKFAVPSLRNVAITGPYMHDGRFATLEQVVAHYASGVRRSATLDPNLAKHPDGGVPLSAADQQALVAFLRTLTDSTFIEHEQFKAEDFLATDGHR